MRQLTIAPPGYNQWCISKSLIHQSILIVTYPADASQPLPTECSLWNNNNNALHWFWQTLTKLMIRQTAAEQQPETRKPSTTTTIIYFYRQSASAEYYGQYNLLNGAFASAAAG